MENEIDPEEKRIIDMKFEMFINFLDWAFDVPEIFPEEVIFMPLADREWKSIFTEKRIELIRMISKENTDAQKEPPKTKPNPKTIGQLAKLLKRHQEAVSRDLKELESIGIVELKKRGREKIPTLSKKLILTPLMVPVPKRKVKK